MAERIGRYTLQMIQRPTIEGYASVVGKKEMEGPLSSFFDLSFDDTMLGESSWEKAESRLQTEAVNLALRKAGVTAKDMDYIFAGDLLNQSLSSTFGLRSLDIPFIGQFGACSTMALTLSMASIFVETGAARKAAAVTSSHFCTAERQFRLPLEYGGQRTPTAQWTATASGSVIVGTSGNGPFVSHVTIGRMVDLGIKDAANMGAAMAPSAAQTISDFMEDTGTLPKDYDLILTGDLAAIGTKLLRDIMADNNLDITDVHNDCGLMLYDREKQDVHAGGSGCGCSASVLCSVILKRLQSRELNNVLFVATGALTSTTSQQQGESVPGVAHLVHLTSM